jgi:hypothetical protein
MPTKMKHILKYIFSICLFIFVLASAGNGYCKKIADSTVLKLYSWQRKFKTINAPDKKNTIIPVKQIATGA